MPAGRLIVCPTPIGNLEDVTLRVLAALAEADVIACEDTRRTGVLLRRHGIEGKLVSYHEHNERTRAAELARRVREGKTVALVSDSGTPAVSDPGFLAVRECLAAGLAVEVLPGPTAVTTALVASGLPGERFCFVGFLPRKRGALRDLLERSGAATLVAYESPRRLGASLGVLAELDPERPAAVCRELTKLHEEVVRGSAAELARRYAAAAPRGEVVLVVGPAADAGGAADEVTDAQVDALAALVEAGARPRKAAAVVAALGRAGGSSGAGANALYRAWAARKQ